MDQVICVKEIIVFRGTQPININKGDRFEIFPVRNFKPFEHDHLCIKINGVGVWVETENFLSLQEFRNQQIDKILD